jgi:hypothetical protein
MGGSFSDVPQSCGQFVRQYSVYHYLVHKSTLPFARSCGPITHGNSGFALQKVPAADGNFGPGGDDSSPDCPKQSKYLVREVLGWLVKPE